MQDQELRQKMVQKPVTLVGNSAQAKSMRDFAEKSGPTQYTILLQGETGGGKDHLAELIHSYGKRPVGRNSIPFVPVDCGSLTAALCESDLFGHIAGAFTDAQDNKQGLVEVAENGTLFFNEVANMSLGLQAKFLRILEKRSFRHVGGTKEIAVNTRFIAATNVDLAKAVLRGEFRLDLYQRLNVITFKVPSLRERKEDIPELAKHFLSCHSKAEKFFLPETLLIMMSYGWPGNVRELMNAVDRAIFYSAPGNEIKPEHVQPFLTGVGGPASNDSVLPLPGVNSVEIFNPCAENVQGNFPTLAESEENYLLELLKRTKRNVSAAHRIAKISRQTLVNKIKNSSRLKYFMDS